MKEINLRATGHSKDKALTPSERDRLRTELKHEKLRIVFILGAYAGLRCREIAQTRFSWIEWQEIEGKKILVLNIPTEARDIRNKYKLFRPKTKVGRTTYIFDNELANEVYFYYKHNIDGLVVSESYIRREVRKHFNTMLGRSLDYEDKHLAVSTHALRSTAQNYFKFELGHADEFIQLCFGWKDLRTIQNHYRTMNRASGESYLKQVLRKE